MTTLNSENAVREWYRQRIYFSRGKDRLQAIYDYRRHLNGKVTMGLFGKAKADSGSGSGKGSKTSTRTMTAAQIRAGVKAGTIKPAAGKQMLQAKSATHRLTNEMDLTGGIDAD